MTVGEVAKKMNTTVFALQYYDKKNILKPSAKSEGGRRLYTDKDIAKLHQIQTMKYLGFSLDDIKSRSLPLDTPDDIVATLTEQAVIMREKIAELSEALQTIEVLKTEVREMQSVDFSKYADIIMNLQMGNEYSGAIKYLDDKTLDDLRSRFDKGSAAEMIQSIALLQDTAIQFFKDGIKPESEEGQELAKRFWDKILEFTDGDVSLFSKFAELAKSASGDNDEWAKKDALASSFFDPALGVYFAKLGVNPFEENTNE
jgi:DNA-binding transcriptional MerR regulator